jgi:chain length determinant protein tyrosine kinase EpsG
MNNPTHFEANESGPLPTTEDVRAIGEILRDMRKLTVEQVEQILKVQREYGCRFGEAAIKLSLVTPDDVLHALSQQFNYAYGTEERRKLSPELVSLNHPFGQQAEAFRMIRSQIQLCMKPAQGAVVHACRALAVVSPNAGDGKTFFSANLAVALAQLGGRVIAVDADMRGPRLHQLFDVSGETGLSALLSGRSGDGVIRSVAGISNLFVLPVGVVPPNPLELVEGPAFGLLIQELLSRFDHVIVDTPATEYGADAVVIAARCGHALVLARKDKARVGDLQQITHMLRAANASVDGVVMNDY